MSGKKPGPGTDRPLKYHRHGTWDMIDVPVSVRGTVSRSNSETNRSRPIISSPAAQLLLQPKLPSRHPAISEVCNKFESLTKNRHQDTSKKPILQSKWRPVQVHSNRLKDVSTPESDTSLIVTRTLSQESLRDTRSPPQLSAQSSSELSASSVIDESRQSISDDDGPADSSEQDRLTEPADNITPPSRPPLDQHLSESGSDLFQIVEESSAADDVVIDDELPQCSPRSEPNQLELGRHGTSIPESDDPVLVDASPSLSSSLSSNRTGPGHLLRTVSTSSVCSSPVSEEEWLDDPIPARLPSSISQISESTAPLTQSPATTEKFPSKPSIVDDKPDPVNDEPDIGGVAAETQQSVTGAVAVAPSISEIFGLQADSDTSESSYSGSRHESQRSSQYGNQNTVSGEQSDHNASDPDDAILDEALRSLSLDFTSDAEPDPVSAKQVRSDKLDRTMSSRNVRFGGESYHEAAQQPEPRLDMFEYPLIKHGRQGRRRRIYLTVDLGAGIIRWGNGRRWMQIEHILQIRSGKQTAVLKRRSADDVDGRLCLSLITRDRSLDLECKTVEERKAVQLTVMNQIIGYLRLHNVRAGWVRPRPA